MISFWKFSEERDGTDLENFQGDPSKERDGDDLENFQVSPKERDGDDFENFQGDPSKERDGDDFAVGAISIPLVFCSIVK